MSTAQTVATSTLFDYVYDQAGVAVSGARVTVTLAYALAYMASPVVSLAPVQKSVTTDSNGYWQFTLVSNTNISPANTYYTVQTPYNSYRVRVGTGGPYQATASGTWLDIPTALPA